MSQVGPPDPGGPDRPTGALVVLPVHGIGEVAAGDDLAAVLWAALTAGPGLLPGDVLAVSSKVVSKALGLVAPPDADRQALVLRESARVVAERATARGVTRVVEALAGPVMVGAGIDASNTGPADRLLLLPRDPDAVCRDLRAALVARSGCPDLAVVLTDTAGRPWRRGQTDLAIGAAGLRVLDDLRGGVDADGRALSVTERAVADEIAAAADLVKGKALGVPAAVVRGLAHLVADGPGARHLVRAGPGDWFALASADAVRAALAVPPGSELSRSVGLVPAVPEGPGALVARARRAARVALDPVGIGWTLGDAREGEAGGGPDHVTITPDAQAGRAGYACARVEVAAASEDLTARVLPGWRVRLTHGS